MTRKNTQLMIPFRNVPGQVKQSVFELGRVHCIEGSRAPDLHRPVPRCIEAFRGYYTTIHVDLEGHESLSPRAQ